MKQKAKRGVIETIALTLSKQGNIHHYYVLFLLLGGALLGTILTSVVTIAKSDYPNGRFGFKGQLEVKLGNPANQIQRMFTVERTGGLLGQQTVCYNFAFELCFLVH